MSTKPKTTAAAAAAAIALAVAGAGSATPGGTGPQAAPREQEQPRISGEPRVGATLTTDNGRWANSPTRFSYRWERCATAAAARCTPPPPPLYQKTYPVRAGDAGKWMRVWVRACNADGCSRANSRPVGPVTGNAAPRNTAVPRINGSTVVGQTLTGAVGAWTNGVAGFSTGWQRCDANGASCASIAGAAGRTYALTNADLNHRLRFVVTATNNRGSTTAVSAPSDVVRAAGPAGQITLPSGETSVPVASIALPQRLIISAVKFEPPVVRSRNEPLVGRFRVTDTRGFVVRDALVYAIGVPPNRVSFVPETVTGQDGWATLTYRILRRQPMARGAQITFFVRARKPGDNLLAGVSTRRLVSLRVSPR